MANKGFYYKMALEAFVDIRFGDPVVSLALTCQGLAYGTLVGRIIYHNFYSKTAYVIHELSDEYVPGVWLSHNDTLFAAIGDQRVLVVDSPMDTRPVKHYILHEKLHNSVSCERTQVRMHQDTVLLFSIQSSEDLTQELTPPVYVTHLGTRRNQQREGLSFPYGSVPCDYDGEKLLWLGWDEHRAPCLNVYYIRNRLRPHWVLRFPRGYGSITHPRLLSEKVVFVRKLCTIVLVDAEGIGSEVEVGRHCCEVVALSAVKLKPQVVEMNGLLLAGGNRCQSSENELVYDMDSSRDPYVMGVLSVDVKGNIRIWDMTGLVETISIKELPELTDDYQRAQYFAMGYPYTLTACGCRLALSTDLGVLVIRSKYLESLELK